MEDRKDREDFFTKLYNQPLNEITFSEIIKKLWASQIWGNKDYLIDKIIKENTFQKIKSETKILLNVKYPVFRQVVSVLGNC